MQFNAKICNVAVSSGGCAKCVEQIFARFVDRWHERVIDWFPRWLIPHLFFWWQEPPVAMMTQVMTFPLLSVLWVIFHPLPWCHQTPSSTTILQKHTQIESSKWKIAFLCELVTGRGWLWMGVWHRLLKNPSHS